MVVIADRPRRSKFLAADDAHAHASAMVEEQYQNFDVVWAKLGSFPWWPGVLFFSWDAVNESGLDLKQTQNQLPIPPPTMHTLPDGSQRLVCSVLIMFLDRFNCSVIEVTPKTVCPFAINYHRLKDKHKGKAGFKVALGRAMRLLHMDNHMTVEDLDAIAPIRVQPTEEEAEQAVQEQQQLTVRPTSGKRQKRTHARHAAAKDDLGVDDFDEDVEEEEEEASLESDYTDGEREAPAKRSAKSPKKKGKKAKDAATVSVSSSKKASPKDSPRILDLSAGENKPKPSRSKQGAKKKPQHHADAIDDDDGDSDFEIVSSSVRPPAKAPPSRKKASRKEGRIHHEVIDIDGDDDDDSSGDFQMSIVPPLSKGARQGSTKAKSGKRTKGKSDTESAAPSKQKKNQRDSDVEGAPASKSQKKKVPKRHNHHGHTHGHIEKATSFEAEPSREPVTLTPLSTIWTAREGSNGVDDGKTNAENFARLAYKLDLLWDEAMFTDDTPTTGSSVEVQDAAETTGGATSYNERGVGKRQVRSVQQSQIRQSMLSGNLDPHTMVQCEAYLPKGGASALVEAGSSRSRGAALQIESPFEVVVHPDVVFVCDLHSHLATCEIIGFLGGRWDDETKTLYIQAAFPCRSLEIEGDDGSTDVEMDPGSEIELREIIQNAELEVVGWYHSHPEFAPDPSIRDIENQTSYQQLFQRSKVLEGGKTEVSYPFVGLIVGTYDQRRESPVGLFRYFHTREERLNSGMRGAVYMPYELVPRKRHYRSVLQDAKRDELRRLPLYVSVAEVLFGADKVCFVKSPVFPRDDKETRAHDLGGAQVSAENANVAASGRKKKRKGSTDLAQAAKEELVQPPKKKRGRPKAAKTDSTTVNLEGSQQHSALPVANAEAVPDVVDVVEPTPDVIDLVTDTSQDLSHSQEHVSPSVSNNVDSIEEARVTDPTEGVRTSRDTFDSVSSNDVPMADPGVTNHKNEGAMDSVSSKDASKTVPDADVTIYPAEDTNYDASQSQNTSDSQPNSQPDEQPDEEFASDPPSKRLELEDDPYAGIEILKSKETPSIVATEESRDAIDPTSSSKHPETNLQCDEVVVTSDASDKTPSEEAPSRAESNPLVHVRESGGANDQSSVVQDVVGESESDIAVQSIVGSDESGAQIADCVIEQTPTEDESGLNSGASGGGSTPVDASLVVTGRRRTRKPSLTVRRTSGTAASPGRTNTSTIGTSPLDPALDAKSANESIKTDVAPALSAVKSVAPIAKEPLSAVDSSWAGIEVIGKDFVDITPLSIEIKLPTQGEEKAKPDIEQIKTTASVASTKVEANPISEPVAMKQTEAVFEPLGAETSVASTKVEANPFSEPVAMKQTEAVIERLGAETSVASTKVEADLMNEPVAMKLSEAAPESKAAAVQLPQEAVGLPKEETASASVPVDGLQPESSPGTRFLPARVATAASTALRLEPGMCAPALVSNWTVTEPGATKAPTSNDYDQWKMDQLRKECKARGKTIKRNIEEEGPVRRRWLRENDLERQGAVGASPGERTPNTTTGGERKATIKEPVDLAGICEPLELYNVKVLRTVVGQMHAGKLVPDIRKGKKEGFMAAIRTVWRQQLSSSNEREAVSGGVNAPSSQSSNLAEIVAGSHSETEGASDVVIILDEPKEAVRSLVTSVETTVSDAIAAAPTPTEPGWTRSERRDPTSFDPAAEPESGGAVERVSTASLNVTTDPAAVQPDSAEAQAVTKPQPSRLQDRHAVHLKSLRTKYGSGAHGCTEQVITLIDYYRDFHRRTELYDSWKGKILRVDKIEASLRADVEHVNLPVALRDEFIKDVMGYLRTSWKLSGRSMR